MAMLTLAGYSVLPQGAAQAAEEVDPSTLSGEPMYRQDSYEVGIQEIAITVLEIVAFLALIVITGGVIYLSFQDFMDRRQQQQAGNEELGQPTQGRKTVSSDKNKPKGPGRGFG